MFIQHLTCLWWLHAGIFCSIYCTYIDSQHFSYRYCGRCGGRCVRVDLEMFEGVGMVF